ncbi:MAG: hypothetical protein KZQ97_09310 [Candidatus Thiodiazotropha sp. (ex Dulcina madagascariensis)]|nr:hypothetical protein [Candidatus Thiodiazotropha sp. (ex Dulcina madagascariensis)]
MKNNTIEILVTARRIADHAKNEGIHTAQLQQRAHCEHMGVVLADSVLQAGLNYRTVVQPRIQNILLKFPDMNRITTLSDLIDRGETASFLAWEHPQKTIRFELLVNFLRDRGIEYVEDLRNSLMTALFVTDLQTINGIGPKTVDYMSCLVGIDSIAVDRHVRAFAKRVGVTNDDYYYLQKVFCYAADLLEVPRRELDAWIWKKESGITSSQLGLAI